MKPINGNLTGLIQIKSSTAKNEIGEVVPIWADIQMLTGFLDYISGDSQRTNFDAKIQESTHIFIADYVALDSRIKAENSRFLVNGRKYDVLLIDDPMELHAHFEIYLKYTGD